MSTLLGIALLAAAAGSPVDVSVTLNPPVIPFHRQAEYTISVEAPEGVDVKFPQMVGKLGGLEASDLRRDTKPLRGNRRLISETYILDPILVGTYKIYPAEVKWGENDGVTVPSPALRVRDLTEDEKKDVAQFADIAGPVPVKGVVEKYWKIWTGVAVLALIAVAVSWFLYKRRQRRLHQAPPPPPWEIAYQRLRELDERQLPKAGQYEPFYVDLSAILRYYIEDCFNLRAPEQTTQEFLATAGGSNAFSNDQQKLLSEFLRHSDYVKFAQYIPTVAEMERCFAFVLQFVDETAPKPEPESKEEAA